MTGSKWTDADIALRMNTMHCPGRLGWQDSATQFLPERWNGRSNRTANSLRDLGVGFCDTFGVISYNRSDWRDTCAGSAEAGQVVVPVMSRLVPPEIEYIVDHSECKGLVVETPFVNGTDSIKHKELVPEAAYVCL